MAFPNIELLELAWTELILHTLSTMKTLLRRACAGLLAALLAFLPGLSAQAAGSISAPKASAGPAASADAVAAAVVPSELQGISSLNLASIGSPASNLALPAPLADLRPTNVAPGAPAFPFLPASAASESASQWSYVSEAESSVLHAPTIRGEERDSLSAEHRLIAHLLDNSGSYAALKKRLKDIRVPAEEATPEEISRRITRYFGPYLDARAKKSGFSKTEDYSRWILSSAEDNRERGKILGQIRLLSGYYAETWSWFFRQYGRWAGPLESYLERLIQWRKGDDRPILSIKDIGVGHGQEPYSLALSVHRALERAGEDPDRWQVEIAAYDVNIASLWSVERAKFSRESVTIPKTYSDAKLDRLLEDSETSTIVRMHPRLRSWIKPVFLNLNDLEQHDILRRTPTDIIFAEHVLFHLERAAANWLAEELLQGNWGLPGEWMFLSLGETLVTELAPLGRVAQDSVKLKKDFPLVIISRFGSHISHLIETFVERWDYGLTWRVQSWTSVRKLGRAVRAFFSWIPLLKFWKTAWLVVGLSARFHKFLLRDPAHEEVLDASVVEFARQRFESELGLKLGLLADARPYELDVPNRTLKLNIGWFIEDWFPEDWYLEDAPAAASVRKDVLRELSERIAARLPPKSARAEEPAAPPRAFFYPNYGDGEVLFVGVNREGAILKAVRFPENRYRLLWLVGPRLYPYFGLRWGK